MTTNEHIKAIAEILRDCGRWIMSTKLVVFEYVNEELFIYEDKAGKLRVSDLDGWVYLNQCAPFEIQGYYEALVEKYGRKVYSPEEYERGMKALAEVKRIMDQN